MEDGFYDDDGTRIDEDSIPIPDLCALCKRNELGEIACTLTRFDQCKEIEGGEMFCCFAFESKDPNIDGRPLLAKMEEYLKGKYDSSEGIPLQGTIHVAVTSSPIRYRDCHSTTYHVHNSTWISTFVRNPFRSL